MSTSHLDAYCYVYAVFNDSINQMVYVGMTKDLERRTGNLRHSIAKGFKESFRIEVLEKTDIRNGLEIESFWINSMIGLGCELMNKNRELTSYDRFLGVDHFKKWRVIDSLNKERRIAKAKVIESGL